jgi:hypothetical protein
MSLGDPVEDMPRLRQYLVEAGRDPAKFSARAPLMAGDGGNAAWIEAVTKLQMAGVTHLSIAAPPAFAPMDGLGRIVEARAALADALGQHYGRACKHDDFRRPLGCH